ncbi:hypothetical protein HDU97_009788 [Phlyctochytrium planicorne]|nr:hypothetical protein HDU97_009788 [Phlyctochytrium planicorne]
MLLDLPIELYREIAVKLNPHQVLILPSLCKQSYLIHFHLDFLFARANLLLFHSNKKEPELGRSLKELNFDRLGKAYWSALISLFGVTETTFYLLYPNYDPPPPRPRPCPDPIVSALMTAIQYSCGPDLTLDDHFALMWVSSTEEVQHMAHLLPKSLPLEEMEKFLQCAAAFGAVPMVKFFLDIGVNPGAEDNLALRLAAENGNDSTVAQLLQCGTKVNPAADHDHALRLASENGHSEVVRLLLADGRCTPSASNNASLIEASCNGHCAIVKMLLETGVVDVAADSNAAIRGAASHGHGQVVEVLLKYGGGVGVSGVVERNPTDSDRGDLALAG